MTRRDDLARFYDILAHLAERTGGPRTLDECHGRMPWPERGVYFFLDRHEGRTDSGEGMRVVRVGTHALTGKSRSTLWKRLSQHRGVEKTGGGNHRGSIFRLLAGTALKACDGRPDPESWGVGQDPNAVAKKLGCQRRDVLDAEASLERDVSAYIRALPFLWLRVEDPPGKDSLRGFIERNAIGLLSNYHRQALDAAAESWLGLHCDRERVQTSGLWNNNHVDETHDPGFLSESKTLAGKT